MIQLLHKLKNLPHEIKNYIYEFFFDYSYIKIRILKELISFSLSQKCYIHENAIHMKPSKIKGKYKISYS